MKHRRAIQVVAIVLVLVGSILWGAAEAATPNALDAPIQVEPLEVAVRGTQVQIITPPPPPTPPVGVLTGLHGQPYAPDGLSDCDEMTFYREQWGLPPRFDQLGWRESNCRNEESVKTFCCYGYWQMFTSMHLRDHRLAPKMAECEVTSSNDLNSDDPREKQRQACAAKALYDVVGLQPWAL